MRFPKGKTQQCLVFDAALWERWQAEAAKRGVSGVGMLRGVMRVLSDDTVYLDNILDDDGLFDERPYAQLGRLYLETLASLGGECFNTEIAKAMGKPSGRISPVLAAHEKAGYVRLEKRRNGKQASQWYVTLTDAGRAAL